MARGFIITLVPGSLVGSMGGHTLCRVNDVPLDAALAV